MAKLATGKEVLEALARTGKTHADLAAQLGVDRGIVRGVLYGRLKGTRGEAHKVAVALGLKRGVVVDDASNLIEAVRVALAA